MDRRIKKTRDLLKETLTGLMEEKELRNISVRELTDRANINRGTFYLHYQDIYEMIDQLEDEIIFNLLAIIEKNSPISADYYILPILLQVIEYLYKDMRFCKALLGKNGDSNFLAKLKTPMMKQARRSLPNFNQKYDETFVRFLTVFIVSGGAGVFQEWFNESCKVPLRSVIAPCEVMITSGIEKITQA